MPIPEFVSALRARVGTDPLWLAGVSAVVLHPDGGSPAGPRAVPDDGSLTTPDDGTRVLLGRRSDNGLWAVISGILEPGEQPAVGIAREILEETGVEATIDALTAVTVTDEVEYPNGDRAQYLDLCFLARPLSAQAAAAARVGDDESTEVAWWPLDDLPEELAPSSRERIRHTLAYLRDPSAGAFFGR